MEINTPDYITPPILEGDFNDTGQVVLNWRGHATNKEGYYLQRSVSREFHHFREFFLNKDVHHFNDSEIVPGTQFFYRIRAYNDNTVSDFSNTFSIVVPTINPHLEQAQFSLSPNPSNGEFHVKLISQDTGQVHIRIANILGQVIFDKKYLKTFSSFKKQIKITPSPGLYVLILSTKKKTYKKKIIFAN
jgi:hypothetical protein